MVRFFICKKGLMAENDPCLLKILVWLGAVLLEGRLYWRLYGTHFLQV